MYHFQFDDSQVPCTSSSLRDGNNPPDAPPLELPEELASMEGLQMNTVSTEGGGKILLVHEKSRVAGEPDMVHVYLLAAGADESATPAEEPNQLADPAVEIIDQSVEVEVDESPPEIEVNVDQSLVEPPAGEDAAQLLRSNEREGAWFAEEELEEEERRMKEGVKNDMNIKQPPVEEKREEVTVNVEI